MRVLPKPVQSCTQALCTVRNEVLTANETWPWIPLIRGDTNSVGSCLISTGVCHFPNFHSGGSLPSLGGKKTDLQQIYSCQTLTRGRGLREQR